MLEKFQLIALQSTKTIILDSVLVEVMNEFASDIKALPSYRGQTATYLLRIFKVVKWKKQKGDP